MEGVFTSPGQNLLDGSLPHISLLNFTLETKKIWFESPLFQLVTYTRAGVQRPRTVQLDTRVRLPRGTKYWSNKPACCGGRGGRGIAEIWLHVTREEMEGEALTLLLAERHARSRSILGVPALYLQSFKFALHFFYNYSNRLINACEVD